MSDDSESVQPTEMETAIDVKTEAASFRSSQVADLTQEEITLNEENQMLFSSLNLGQNNGLGLYQSQERATLPLPSAAEPMPFACTLCSAKFPKKLLLSSHVEKRHGVKYVFTERGKKVKLVRMPENVDEGDRLDPFVELLMKKAAGGHQDTKNAILVHSVEPNSAFSGVAEELNPEDLLRNAVGDAVSCGILVDNINTDSYNVARSRNEIPFVALGCFYSENYFLLRVVQLTEKKQMLVPANVSDLRNSQAVKTDASPFADGKPKVSGANSMHGDDRYGTSSDPLQFQCQSSQDDYDTPDLNQLNLDDKKQLDDAGLESAGFAVVAHADVVMNEETNNFEIQISSPVKDKLSAGHQLIGMDDFNDMVLLCKPQRLRCLSEAYTSIAEIQMPENAVSERPKRKYTRRNYGKENKDSVTSLKDMKTDVDVDNADKEETSEGRGTSRRWSRKSLDLKDEDYDDEEKDATYNPKSEQSEMPRRRGRPRKLLQT